MDNRERLAAGVQCSGIGMEPNPYQPVGPSRDELSVGARLLRLLREPTPVRADIEQPFRWLLDAFVAFGICLGGMLVSGFAAETLPFLGPMSYPTALVAGLVPLGLWMHYCHAGRSTSPSNMALVTSVMVLMALRGGIAGLLFLPASLAVLAVVVPIEIAIGKVLLSCLPGSSSSRFNRAEKLQPTRLAGAQTSDGEPPTVR